MQPVRADSAVTTLLRLAQRHAGCRETGLPCGDPPTCGCALEAAVEREDGTMMEENDQQQGFDPL